MNTGIICVFALEDRDTWNETADLFYNFMQNCHALLSPAKKYVDYTLMLSAAILKLFVGCCALDQMFHGCNKNERLLRIAPD